MTDWKEDKNLGPWSFVEQPNKWGYLNNPRWLSQPSEPVNYTGNESNEPQIWTPKGDGGPFTSGESNRHSPCGHWHKREITDGEVGGEIETYIEILSSGCCFPYQGYGSSGEIGPPYDTVHYATFRPLNTDDYAGSEVTYTFEITASNVSEINNGYVYLVDESYNIVATIEVPQGYHGPYTENSDGTGAARYRARQYWLFSVEFTPIEGAHQYGLRLYLASQGTQPFWTEGPQCILKVPSARIVVRQKNPVTSVVHIPMFSLANWCQMDWVNVPSGTTVTSGAETGGYDIENFTYLGNDVGTYWDSQSRQRWKFDSGQLSQVDKVVFDAGIAYVPYDYIPTSIETIFGVPGLFWIRSELRWSTYNTATPANFTVGNYGDATCWDAGGHAFHLIGGSQSEWTITDGVPDSETVYPNLSDLANADGYYLYICTNENVLGGPPYNVPSGFYHHWGRYRSFSIPVGRSLSTAWLVCYAYYNSTLSRYEYKLTFDYELIPADIRNAYIILYDVTADSYIAESELIWDTFETWSRKSVELDASVLTSGHEYIVSWKCENLPGGTYPYVTDVNLWLKVNEVESFTSWLRIVKQSMSDWRFPGIYNDYLDAVSLLYLDVSVRAKPFLPSGATAYLEVSYYDHDMWEGHERLSIWDAGDDLYGIGSAISAEVSESVMVLGTDTEVILRDNTDTIPLKEDQYVINSYSHSYNNDIRISSGFIVVEYNL